MGSEKVFRFNISHSYNTACKNLFINNANSTKIRFFLNRLGEHPIYEEEKISLKPEQIHGTKKIINRVII